jgi:hypothetical protein
MKNKILTIISCILLAFLTIFVFLNSYHRKQLKKVKEWIEQDAIEDSVRRFNDSISFKEQIEKLEIEKMLEERKNREAASNKEIKKKEKQIKKNEELIKKLPDGNFPFNDSIWQNAR